MDVDTDHTVAIIGGTGPQGRGLALRFALAGVPVVIGSRDAERAERAADELNRALSPAPDPAIRGAANTDAARAGRIVVITVPYEGHASLLESLRESAAGRIVVDCVNPLGFDGRGGYAVEVPEGSAAEQAAALLPDSTVIGAFHHVSAAVLNDLARSTVDCDVMVLGEDRTAATAVADLASRIPGMRGIYSGRLRNARQVETLTANIVAINRRYRTDAGIRITGV